MVHKNMKSRTEGLVSLVTGLIHIKSPKQNLNTKRLEGAELVGMGEYLAYNIWLKMFW